MDNVKITDNMIIFHSLCVYHEKLIDTANKNCSVTIDSDALIKRTEELMSTYKDKFQNDLKELVNRGDM